MAVAAEEMPSMYYAMLPGVVPVGSHSPRSDGERSGNSSDGATYGVKTATAGGQDANGLRTTAGGQRSPPDHTPTRSATQFNEHFVDNRTPTGVLVSGLLK